MASRLTVSDAERAQMRQTNSNPPSALTDMFSALNSTLLSVTHVQTQARQAADQHAADLQRSLAADTEDFRREMENVH